MLCFSCCCYDPSRDHERQVSNPLSRNNMSFNDSPPPMVDDDASSATPTDDGGSPSDRRLEDFTLDDCKEASIATALPAPVMAPLSLAEERARRRKREIEEVTLRKAESAEKAASRELKAEAKERKEAAREASLARRLQREKEEEDRARHALAPRYPVRLEGSWTEQSATGWKEVEGCPQYRLVPSTSGTVTLCFRGSRGSPKAALTLVKARPHGALHQGPFPSPSTSSSSPSSSGAVFYRRDFSFSMPVTRGVAYTLIITTHTPWAGLTQGERSEAKWRVGVKVSPSGRDLQCLEPITPLTSTFSEVQSQGAAREAEVERVRRQGAVASMRAAAEASPLGSTLRASWVDFCRAAAEVERRREVVRRTHVGLYRDGWSGGVGAVGEGLANSLEWQEATWVDWKAIAPHPTFCRGGFDLGGLEGGEALGERYFLRALEDAVEGLEGVGTGASASASAAAAAAAILDPLFITTQPNPEGVYCLRLWVKGAWRWFFMDPTFPVHSFLYHDGTKEGALVSSSSGKSSDPSQGRMFHSLCARSTHSPNIFWPAFLEKAWAMLHGTYSAIEGHAIPEEDSQPIHFFMPNTPPGIVLDIELPLDAHGFETLWEKLKVWAGKGWSMRVGGRGGVGGLVEAEEDPPRGSSSSSGRGGGSPWCPREDESYSLLRVCEVGEVGRLVELKGKGGSGSGKERGRERGGGWRGAFSHADTSSWTPEVLETIGLANAPPSTPSSSFWMPFADFARLFQNVRVCPSTPLVKDGGPWHKWVAKGCLGDGGSSGSSSNIPLFTGMVAHRQYLLYSPHPGAEFSLHLELDERPKRVEEGGVPTVPITLCTLFLPGNDGSIPLGEEDLAAFQGLSALPAPWGVIDVVLKNKPMEGAFAIIPQVAVGEEGRHTFTLSVTSKSPFWLATAPIGGEEVCEEGITCLSEPLKPVGGNGGAELMLPPIPLSL